MNKGFLTLAFFIFLGLLALQSFFVVHQTEQAIVVQLGDPLDKVYGPGLHFKIPFIQNVLTFDSRILDYDARSAEALTSDKKAIVLDNYARWIIKDPLQFYRSVRSFAGAQARLDDVVYSQLRAIVGQHTLTEVVSSNRIFIMQEVTKLTSEIMKQYGIEVVDVRIKRTDLPKENQLAIFGRMRAERERQARQYRSEGVEESTKLRSAADREQAVIMADAQREALILQGEADAEAAKIYSEAFAQSPEFYEFQRGLETLKKVFDGKTRIIIEDNDPILKPLQR